LEGEAGAEVVEVVRLWRLLEGGQLIPEMDGRKYPAAAELDAEQHARLSLALVDLYGWLAQAPHTAPSIESILSPAREQPGSAGGPSVGGPGPGRNNAASNDLPRRVSLNPFKAFLLAARQEVKQPLEAAPKSIAAQIDEILQRKLVDSQLEGCGVRLMELPEKGMVIFVGLEEYADVEAVPDEAVRDLIRAAVAEWEARMLGESAP